MSPALCRHTLIWSLPALVGLLTLLWYKRKRGSSRSDPGGTAKGTRKTKKQEEAPKLVSSLLSNSCKVQVSEIDSATSQEEAQSLTCHPVTECASLAEKQESEYQITVNVTKKLTIEPSLPLNSTGPHSCTNSNCSEEELFVECDEKESVYNTKLGKVKESLLSTSNLNYDSRCSTEEISYNTNSEVVLSLETNPETAFSQETDSQIIVSSSTNFERTLHSKIKLDILVSPGVTTEALATPNNTGEVSFIPEITLKFAESQVTDSEPCALQETNLKVTDCTEEVIYKVNPEDCVLNEVDSEACVLNEIDPEASALNKIDSEVCFINEIDSEACVLNEIDSEACVSNDINSEAQVSNEINSEAAVSSKVVSEVAFSSEVGYETAVSSKVIPEASVADEVGIDSRTLFVDHSCVSDSNSSFAVNEEAVPVVEFCSAKDSISVIGASVSDNSSECHSEEETMPGAVGDTCKLDTTSNTNLVTKSEELKPTYVEVTESSLLKISDTTETLKMKSQLSEEAPGEGGVAAANGDCSLEGKLATLDLGKGRDSANHSPAEVMLGSPASSYSDEGSSDSGKGCSDLATPPSRTPASGSSVSGDATALSVYEFVIPQQLVGRLIGRHGAFVHQIKAQTNASILIKRHPDTHKLKICAVEGTQLDIDSALEMIRKKFPLKHYPNVTLEQVCFVSPVSVHTVLSECLQLMLVEGVSNDVILSSLVTPCHFFLQQPTHPTYPALSRLNVCMNMCYSEPNVPLLPAPINPGVICAAPTMGGWFRAQVVSIDNENSTCEVKFVDYGGYLSLEHSALRQIRSDFMTLPFQASECFLANVVPAGGEEASWSPDAAAAVEELIHGQVLQAQVCDYTEENIPNVFLYAVHCNQVVLVNQELVSQGFAEWLTMEEINDASSS